MVRHLDVGRVWISAIDMRLDLFTLTSDGRLDPKFLRASGTHIVQGYSRSTTKVHLAAAYARTAFTPAA